MIENENKNENVMIAMSGGVDSAVAAYLASREREAAGVTMCISLPHSALDMRSEAADAAAVCRLLGIGHFTADFSAEFLAAVAEPFVAEYLAGRTPNPCVDCNRTIKFGALLRFAVAKGYVKLATGHYARIERQNGRYLVRRAADAGKDQTYMLYSLRQEALARAEFPLGALQKDEVREIAASLGFPMAKKRDSQDICFIPDGDYAAYIRRVTGKTPQKGDFIDKDGNKLGTHGGMLCYTVGQRKGLGVAAGHPVYVTAKDPVKNTVTLGENAELFRTRAVVREINFIPFDRLNAPLSCLAKIRYGGAAAPARVEQTGEDELTVEFDAPQRAIVAGQSLVLYDGDYLLGGGKIRG